MKVLVASISLAAFAVSPAHAQQVSTKKPQTCEMEHDGRKMQGVLVKGPDGKMVCKMDHSKMDHSKMGHGEKAPSTKKKPDRGHNH